MNLEEYVEYCKGDLKFIKSQCGHSFKQYMDGRKHFDKDKLEYLEIQTNGLLNARDYLLKRYQDAYEDLKRAKLEFKLEGCQCAPQEAEAGSH